MDRATIKLGEIGKISMCKRILKKQTKKSGDIPFYKISTFGGKADSYIDRALYEDYKKRFSYPNVGDILISAAGTLGRTVIFDGEESFFQDSNIVWVANDESKVLNRYLYYYYKLEPWKTTTGSTINRLYNDNLRDITVFYPEKLEEQKKIVDVLKTIDDKINNNERVNDKLEELARTVYEHWFLQFDFPDVNGNPYKSSCGKMVYSETLKYEIPENWEIVNLLDIADITWGQCPAGKNILPINTQAAIAIDYCSGAGDMKGGFIVDCQAKTDDSKRTAKKGDVLVSIAGKIGDICICDHDISLGRAAMAIYGKDDFTSSMFYYQIMSHYSKVLNKISNGSIQKVISKENIKSINFAVDKNVFENYKKITDPIILEIINLEHENKKLAELRNYLLPLLMNGQAKISE